jgi:hypothetical protein
MTDNSTEGRQLPRLVAISFIGDALRDPDRTVIACPPATVGRAAEVLGELTDLADWAAIIEGAGGWGALVTGAHSVKVAADAGDLCVSLLLRRADFARFALAYGYQEPPGGSWMVAGKVADLDAAAAAWLLGDGEPG